MDGSWTKTGTDKVCRLLAIGLLCTTSILSSSVSPSVAQSLTRLPAVAEESEASVMPGFSAGAWRERTQLVWDGAIKRLVRRNYRIWDPLASLNYELFWIADDPSLDRDGPVSGSGRLVWRRPGAPSYDSNASVAQYVGYMADGRAAGTGEYLHRSGASYRGSWREGVMDGRGTMLLPNADQYIGFFKAGRREGTGIYIDRAGTIYDGGFSLGRREGKGRLSLKDSLTYSAVWRADTEVAGTRRDAPVNETARILAAQYRDYDDVQVGIAVDRRPVLDAASGKEAMPYVSEASAEGLRVFPDDKRMLDVWRGRTDIQAIGNEMYEWPLSFLASPNYYKPVPMIVDVQNRSEEPLRIVGGYLDVKRSRSDKEPAVEVIGPGFGCSATNNYTAGIDILNFGWSDMHNVMVTGGIQNAAGTLIGKPFSRTIETIAEKASVDMAADYGMVDRSDLPTISCEPANENACLMTARRAPAFRHYADVLTLMSEFVVVPFKGKIAYGWQSADKEMHAKESTFSTVVVIGQISGMAECGEGGTEEARFREPFKFKVDTDNYRIPIRLNEDIPAGVTARWRMLFDAEMSSVHDFQVVFQLADGRDVAARPVNFSYFKPRPHPEPENGAMEMTDGDGETDSGN